MTRESDPRAFELVCEAVLLAAIDRAECHAQIEGVRSKQIAEHLGFARTATRKVRVLLGPLVAAGAVKPVRRGGGRLWTLTSDGHSQLAKARRTRQPPQLPEAPQHREWREARSQAAERINGLRSQLRLTLTQASSLLDTEPGDADAWFALAKSVRAQAGYLGAAIYCLHEWPEPDDAHPDRDPQHRKVDTGQLAYHG